MVFVEIQPSSFWLFCLSDICRLLLLLLWFCVCLRIELNWIEYMCSRIHYTTPVSVVFRYDIVYRQAVSTEDMYLQLGSRTPATASCEEMVVRQTSLSAQYWSTGPPVHWSTGPLVHWSTGPLVHWSTGPLVHWSTGPLVHWSTGPRTNRTCSYYYICISCRKPKQIIRGLLVYPWRRLSKVGANTLQCGLVRLHITLYVEWTTRLAPR